MRGSRSRQGFGDPESVAHASQDALRLRQRPLAHLRLACRYNGHDDVLKCRATFFGVAYGFAAAYVVSGVSRTAYLGCGAKMFDA